LCWSFLSAIEDPNAAPAIARAGACLGHAAGGLEPAKLAKAITARYGKDHTFSVPILTMAALAGQLGNETEAWRLIPSLPFELAIFPQSLFRFLQLPVVSYALPALIAMGQVGHHFRPTRNPVARVLRNLSIARTLRVLEAIQPPSGGFLEATPLTSFVAMSLIAKGLHAHAVVRNALHFLKASVRADGSWPIDTNLATWVTTLSVNALSPDALDETERAAIRGWLLGQQYKERHPYTGAAPGGWAWTHLSGGVPDADDTAGALLALKKLGTPDPATVDAVQRGIRWLLDLQNRDGGMPTFCRGWGALPFDRSASDLTAHAIAAWEEWRPWLPKKLAAECERAIRRAFGNLFRQQRTHGDWVPLWFGNQGAPDEENPIYGTSRVLLGMGASGTLFGVCNKERVSLKPCGFNARGMSYLLDAQNADGGWGGTGGVKSTIEETALAVQGLSAVVLRNKSQRTLIPALQRGVHWLIQATKNGTHFPTAPIGLYFAKLWYHERLYPLIFTVAALEKFRLVQELSANGEK
jgi:squalene-hopene/tetraprenyl-beta-curcumene cyclase